MLEIIANHWQFVSGFAALLMSYAKQDSEIKSLKLEVSKLEKKVESQDSMITKVREDIAEIKGITKAIYDSVKK
jgi:peptidoglycan hydrolase CwlO-like protein